MPPWAALLRVQPLVLLAAQWVLWWVVWQVQDEGCGLALEARRFGLPEQHDACCGRGLFLIQQCFDDIRWSPRGNRVQVAVRRVEVR